MSESVKFIEEPCRNCGDATPGNYCRACGQRKGEVRVSMRRLLADVLEDQLSINSTLPRTLGALFVRPGKLTAEYARGRIAAYIAPFRLYLVASLLFFLVASVASRSGLGNEITIDRRTAGSDSVEAAAAVDTAGGQAPTVTSAPAADAPATGERERRPIGITITEDQLNSDSIDWERAINTGIPVLDEMIVERARSLDGMAPREAVRQIVGSMFEYAPTAMFLLLPVFALLLKLMYIRSKRYYVEHFVFALHYHAFAFLIFTLIIVLPDVVRPGLLLIWLFLYLPIALKRVYDQGAFVTFAKWMVISSVYSVLIAFGIFATAIVAFLAG